MVDCPGLPDPTKNGTVLVARLAEIIQLQNYTPGRLKLYSRPSTPDSLTACARVTEQSDKSTQVDRYDNDCLVKARIVFSYLMTHRPVTGMCFTRRAPSTGGCFPRQERRWTVLTTPAPLFFGRVQGRHFVLF